MDAFDQAMQYWPASLPIGLLQRLIRRYREPHRHYHTLEHIFFMFRLLAELEVGPSLALVLAIWYHDAIYNPQATDNEEQSALLAVQELEDVEPAIVALVARMVRMTREHQPDSSEEELLCDLDLAILGAPEEEYRRYSQAIRLEYSWVEDKAYREGRSAVLRSFLSRDSLYFWDALHERLDKPARINMENELSQLAV